MLAGLHACRTVGLLTAIQLQSFVPVCGAGTGRAAAKCMRMHMHMHMHMCMALWAMLWPYVLFVVSIGALSAGLKT